LTTNRRSLPEAGVKRSPSWGVGIAYVEFEQPAMRAQPAFGPALLDPGKDQRRPGAITNPCAQSNSLNFAMLKS